MSLICRRLAFVLVCSLSLVVPKPSFAGLLTTSTDYSVFDFGNFSSSSDITGRLAVQGNMTVSSYGVGSALSSNGGDSLVVGGNLSFTNGSVNHGNVRVGGAASISGFGLGYGKIYYDHAGNPTPPSYLPLQQVAGGGIVSDFFSSAKTYATSLSSTLASQATNGTVVFSPQGQITMTGALTGLNVFNLTVAQFDGASGQGINISAPANATVVVNISGTGTSVASVSNFSFNLSGGIDQQHIVYNFSGVSTLNSSGIGWLGSILAPNTAYSGTYGNVNGDMAIGSVSGTTEFHYYPFLGSLPPPVSSVPEPSSLLGALAGVGLAGAWIRRKANV